MRVEEHIIKARSFLFWQDVFICLFWVGIIGSFFILIGIQLESVFYFLPQTKINILFILAGSAGTIILFWIVQFVRANNNKIYRYQIETLALHLGQEAFPEKSDTILNALQLEAGAGKNESKELAESYIKNIGHKLKTLNIHLLLIDKRLPGLKSALLISWISIILVFSFRYSASADAFHRWAHPQQEYPAPKPFLLSSITGDIHILGGEKTEINIQAHTTIPDTVHLYLTPSQVSTQKRDSLKLKFSAAPSAGGQYHFKLPELFQDYSYQAVVEAQYFWEAWERVASNPDTIFVTDRPAFETFLMTIVPPKYSKLDTETQKGNVAVVQGLKGSVIQINLTSNRMLESAHLIINEDREEMASSYNRASGYFTLMDEGEFTVNLVDKRGITNRDPIPYALEIIPDHDPSLAVIKPAPMIELGSEQTIPIHLEIQDDYGFTDLQLAYEVRRPTYLQADPYVAMFTIQDLIPDTLNQTIHTFWELGDMMLMPEDEVHFHFELTDNDDVSGPKKTISSTFIARVPSLADLYASAESSETDFMENLAEGMDEIQELKDQFEILELKALKSKELDWDQQQSVKNSLEQARKELDNLEKMAEAMESITDQAEKHKLFSPDLLAKFKELSELISDIIPEDMLTTMDDLQKALENMDMKSLQEALNELSENMDQIEQDLDRYLEIFKRLQAEQKMDELQNRMQQLFEQQNALDQEISEADNTTDQSTLERLAQEEQRNLDEFENIKSLLEEASELVEPFSETASQELSEMAESDLAEETQSALNETAQNLSQQNVQSAQRSSQQSIQNMEMMMMQMMDIQQGFQQETVSEMTEKFQALMQDMLYLSSQEEQLRSDVKQASRNSPRLREFASRQQLLQDQLQSITNQMMDLSKETFAITPEIGRGVGKANAAMQEAKNKLTERNVSQSGKNQDMAMAGLNEAALGLFNSMQSMQQSGSASGYEQFLKMMQQMAGQQQGLNQQGMQLSLGQMAAAAQQQMLQQMLKKQKGIRKSLEQMMNEMRHSGQHGMGDLSGIAQEMDEVIKDLQRKRFNRRTQERQQRILSRMLDSQTSMTQRGQKEERKSSSARQDIVFEGPGGLPSDLGQRENLALQALNNAINAGYSREHQTMIKRYFNSLSQIPSETQTIETIGEE